MSKSYTLYIYKKDGRTKAGERLIRTQVYTDQTDSGMSAVADQFIAHWVELKATKKYRLEYFPTMMTVKNLMTGKEVEIDRDTPWCCNPASESHWSN